MNNSLKGLRILNTRPLGQEKAWSLAIKNAGGIAVEFPVLSIEYLTTEWLTSLPDLATFNKAIFISANAVRAFFKALFEHHLTWPENVEVIAIGKATQKALIEEEIIVHYVPQHEDSEHLLALPCLQEISGQKILLCKGEGGRLLIEETLMQRHVELTVLPVYKRGIPHYDPDFIDLIWKNDVVDIILLTSEAAIDNLFTIFHQEAARQWLCSKSCLIISKRLEKKAHAMGIKKLSLLKE